MKAEHQKKLDEITDEISYYVYNVWIIKDLSENIDKKFGIASPYLNFRDALFHYKKMYEAASQNDNFTFIQQQACICEHLNRGLKDFVVHLIAFFYAKILHKMIITKTGAINPEREAKLRHVYHDIKNIVIEIRLEGQGLKHFSNNNNVWLPKVVDAVKALDKFLGEFPTLRQLFNNTKIELIHSNWKI
ncbi:MAG: hypothetical protein LBH44_00285 [Treponema sp.]|nr:hypothetical protein [Treponema sp.]